MRHQVFPVPPRTEHFPAPGKRRQNCPVRVLDGPPPITPGHAQPRATRQLCAWSSNRQPVTPPPCISNRSLRARNASPSRPPICISVLAPTRHPSSDGQAQQAVPSSDRPQPPTCLVATIPEYVARMLKLEASSPPSTRADPIRQPSSRPRAACTRSSTLSKPSHTPVPPLVSWPRTVSSSLPSVRLRRSCWSRTRRPRSSTSSTSKTHGDRGRRGWIAEGQAADTYS